MQTAQLTTTELQQMKNASADALLRVGNDSRLARVLKRVCMHAAVELMARSMGLPQRGDKA